MLEKLLSPEEVSNILGVSKSTIYRWVHHEFIPHVKVGAAVRFDRHEIEEWIRARARKASSPSMRVVTASGEA